MVVANPKLSELSLAASRSRVDRATSDIHKFLIRRGNLSKRIKRSLTGDLATGEFSEATLIREVWPRTG